MLNPLETTKSRVFVAKSGYLRLISELGIFGFSLFLLAIFSMIKRINQIINNMTEMNEQQMLGHVLYIFGIVTVVGGMARTYIWPQMFLILGMCVVYPAVLYSNVKITHAKVDLIH